MNWPEIYLICFGLGSLWSVASLFLGGMGHGAHGHLHLGHAHGGHAHGYHAHSAHGGGAGWVSWIAAFITPGALAVFLAWFGGVGYLLTRHSAFGRWVDLAIAVLVGSIGAFLLGDFLRWLHSHEKPLETTDTDFVGILGRVSSRIRPDGVGEVIYVRDGSRRAVPARGEDRNGIGRDEDVVVTRYEKGIAYVRTWAALTQSEADSEVSEKPAKGEGYVE